MTVREEYVQHFQDIAKRSVPPEFAPGSHYMEIVEAFVKVLNDVEGVKAQLKLRARPEHLQVYISPRYRRHEASVLLDLWLTGPTVTVSGHEQRKFRSEKTFAAYLDAFWERLKVVTFPEFRRLSAEDTNGALRAKGFSRVTQDDVMVRVPNAEHIRLARAVDQANERLDQGTANRENGASARVTLRVIPIEPPVFASYKSGDHFSFLESGGYALRLDGERREFADRSIEVNGVPVTKDEEGRLLGQALGLDESFLPDEAVST